MQSNGALDLVSSSQRVVRNSTEKEIHENVFSSSKLCSLYDKVLEVISSIIAARRCITHSALIKFDTLLNQDNFECRMRASRRRTQRAFASRGSNPDAPQSKAF
jgi:hypothetical protein